MKKEEARERGVGGRGRILMSESKERGGGWGCPHERRIRKKGRFVGSV